MNLYINTPESMKYSYVGKCITGRVLTLNVEFFQTMQQ